MDSHGSQNLEYACSNGHGGIGERGRQVVLYGVGERAFCLLAFFDFHACCSALPGFFSVGLFEARPFFHDFEASSPMID
jgi:hypothetical protein